MRSSKRMVVMGLVVLALMILSMTLSMARSWGPNPIFLAPGLREEGAYTMTCPGTYGHLIPIFPAPWKEPVPTPSRTGSDDGMGDGSTAAAGTGSRSSNPGGLSVGLPKPSGPGSIIPGGSGMPMGNYFSGAIAVNRVDVLENDLRDSIRKLNAK